MAETLLQFLLLGRTVETNWFNSSGLVYVQRRIIDNSSFAVGSINFLNFFVI